MSIIRACIRMTACQALRAKTWAGGLVFDSDNTPLADMIVDKKGSQPFLTVFTDLDIRTELEGNQYYLATRSMRLIVEMGIASGIRVGDGAAQLDIPATDAGMEVTIDLLETQVMAALFGDVKNPWAQLLKNFILRFDRVPSQRGASSEKGKRWAARQAILICDPISDLPPGVPYGADHPIRKFIAMAELEAETSAIYASSQIVKTALSDDVLPEWQQIQALMGLTEKGTLALAVPTGPLVSDIQPDGDTPIPEDAPQIFVPINDEPISP